MQVEWVDDAGSTNEELVRRASTGELTDLTVLATDNQTAGRGRLGRSWIAPPGTALAVSIYVTESGGGWLSLLAGLAMTRAVRTLVGDDDAVSLKWPNDVLVRGRKVSGILGELVPGGAVIGAGLNLSMTDAELPVPTATSLAIEGVEVDDVRDRALSAYLGEFDSLWSEFRDAAFDAEQGLRSAITAACGTLGQTVRVELPDGAVREGLATSIDEQGRLVVLEGAEEFAVSAGDVTHVRAV